MSFRIMQTQSCPSRLSIRSFVVVAAAMLVSFAWSSSVLAQDTLRLLHFERKVRPLLAERCYGCHGPEKQESGLRLDSRDALLRGDESGPVVLPKDAAASRLAKAIRHEGEIHMPPDGKLGDAEIKTLTDWINAGAPWPEDVPTRAKRGPDESLFTDAETGFWSYQPLADVTLPDVTDKEWPESPIDNFVLEALEAQSLTPGSSAGKGVLLRRITYDLTGLPPTDAELQEFLADDSDDAFERVVDRLLGSPHYGERWGRHWMDVARFAESAGHDGNNAYMYAYRYRDYVIDSVNRDKPFDEFVVEQIAGDLLPATGDRRVDYERHVATGFLQIGPKPVVMRDKHQMLLDIADEQVDATGMAFLGLTLGCARCHDHKFDPIPTQDYYSLAGMFMSTHVMRDFEPDSKWITPEIENPDGQKVKIISVRDHPPEERGDLRVHLRGSYKKLGELAPRRFLQIIAGENHAPIETEASGRLELARWIASADNPLTARVFVNRVWQWHFGRGIVASSGDFGIRGQRPTHPELLDYLARWFIDSGWSLKKLHRLLVLSSAYKQSSTFRPEAAEKDPENRFLWHFPRRRLSAEEVRDSILAVSGDLDREMGGSFFDYKAIQAGGDASRDLYALGSRPNYPQPRRAVYIPVVRNFRPHELTIFDAANEHLSTSLRRPTVVAPQALYLMNSVYVRDRARNLASALVEEFESDDVSAIVTAAYRRVLGRSPAESEIDEAQEFVDHCREMLRAARQSQPSTFSSSPSEFSSYADVILASPDLVAYYQFEEEGLGVADGARDVKNSVVDGAASGVFKDGQPTVTEGALVAGGVDASRGQALSFQEDTARVHIDNVRPFNTIRSELSLEYWARPDKLQASMIAGRDGHPRLWKSGVIPRDVDGEQKNVVYSDLLALSGFKAASGPAAVAEIGRWTHVVMTFNSVSRELWVNGVRVQSVSEPGEFPTGAGTPFTVGGTYLGREAFTGSVDEVAVYSRALHPREITQHHAIGVGSLAASEFEFPKATLQSLELDAWITFCQTLFWMNEFLYVE